MNLLKEKCHISILVSIGFDPKGQIDDKLVFVQVMALYHADVTTLRVMTQICVSRLSCVNPIISQSITATK